MDESREMLNGLERVMEVTMVWCLLVTQVQLGKLDRLVQDLEASMTFVLGYPVGTMVNPAVRNLQLISVLCRFKPQEALVRNTVQARTNNASLLKNSINQKVVGSRLLNPLLVLLLGVIRSVLVLEHR